MLLLENASAQMAKERWKKFTKDLNKDLMSMAEDPEMFKEAALLLFGTSFEKKMKDHLESLKCLRQYMAPKSGYRSEQFFRVSASGRWQQLPRKRRTDSTPIPTKEAEERDRDHSGGTASSTEMVYTETIYATLLRTLKFNAFILCMNLTIALLANIVFILLVYVP